MLLRHFRHKVFPQVMYKGLDGYQQVAVSGGHHDRQDTGQGQSCKAGRQDAYSQGRHHGIGASVGGHHVRQNLLACQTHEKYKDNGYHVNGSTPEHALGGCLFAFGSKGPLPHLGPCQGKHQIGDNVSQDTAVEMGDQVGFVQVLPEGGKTAQVTDAGEGNQDIDKDYQHEKLEHIRVHHAEEAGCSGVDDEYNGCHQGACFIADAEFISQHLDDGGSGSHLGSHRAHHGKYNHESQDAAGSAVEPVVEKLRYGIDVSGVANLLYTSGDG